MLGYIGLKGLKNVIITKAFEGHDFGGIIFEC